MARTPISSLFGATLSIRRAEFGRTETEDEAARHNHLILYRVSGGKNDYVATVSEDDLFDPHGMLFDGDE